MKLLAFLCGCLVAAPLCALEKVGATFVLTPEEDATCEENGGCLVVPRAVLEEAVQEHAQRAYLAGLAKCRT